MSGGQSAAATGWIAGLLLCAAFPAATGATSEPRAFDVPAWLFPIPPPAPAATAAPVRPPDPVLVHVPGSNVAYTRAGTRDYFAVPDWFPESHPTMPEIVSRGRRPDIYACGFCHLPDGAGRPENATLAGLPAEYIVQQVRDFGSGARRSAWSGSPYLPTALMAKLSPLVTEPELAAAAAYFSALALHGPRAEVIETERLPGTRAVAWIYASNDEARDEPLGERIVEMPRDFSRHELRDPNTVYVAYVPPGSVARGRKLAMEGGPLSPACTSCHGPELRGVGLVPPIAGRSPTYLLRQLVAFRTGARHTREGAPMQPVVDGLSLDEMIAVAAYAGALEP